MIKFRHILRFIEGRFESGHFNDVATLKYESHLPSAPVRGLIVELNDFVQFEVATVKYLASEETYETFSHIDFFEIEDRIEDYVPRAYWVAKYVKYGFSILSLGSMSRDELDLAIQNYV